MVGILTTVEEVIKDLERKANLTREIHAYSSKKCKTWMNAILIFTIIFTMLIAFFSLSGPLLFPMDENGRNIFAISVAIIGLAVLFLSVSDRIFGFNERYAAHSQGIRLLTDFIRECHQIRHVDLDQGSEEENSLKLEALQHAYSQLNHLLPINDISDREFLDCKQKFYLKVEVSKKLDADPHLDIDESMRINKSIDPQN